MKTVFKAISGLQFTNISEKGFKVQTKHLKLADRLVKQLGIPEISSFGLSLRYMFAAELARQEVDYVAQPYSKTAKEYVGYVLSLKAIIKAAALAWDKKVLGVKK